MLDVRLHQIPIRKAAQSSVGELQILSVKRLTESLYIFVNGTRSEDLEAFEQAEPYLRTALAFLIHMRFNYMSGIDVAYRDADLFLDQLRKDLT